MPQKRIFSDELPLTLQLAQLLRNRIARGELSPGGRIAPEVRLAEEFGVSVITVQRALKELENERLITRHRGRGTFVRFGPAVIQPPAPQDALALMFVDAYEKGTKAFDRKVIDRPTSLNEVFPTAPKIMRLERIVYRGGKPWSHATIFILPELGKRLSLSMFQKYPTFRLARDTLGVKCKDVAIQIRSSVPDPRIAKLLQLKPLDPVLRYTGSLRDSSDRFVILTELTFSTRFVFQLNMDVGFSDETLTKLSANKRKAV